MCVPVSKLRTPLGVAVLAPPWNELPEFSRRLKPVELPPGIVPKPSVKLTVPVGVPCPDKPKTSARKYTKLPNGPPLKGIGFPCASAENTESVVVLFSGVTVIEEVAESLAAKVASPA